MTRILLATCLLAGVAACQSTEDRRVEGLTLVAGNAIAQNTALQVIDPWPAGVQNTDLVVPAERAASATSATEGTTTKTVSE